MSSARSLRVLALLLLGLHVAPAVTAEEPAVDAPGFYAGRDAAWWVEELRGAGTSRAAYEALKIIGAPALPEIAKVLNHRDPSLRDMALGLLREIPGDLRAAAPLLGQALGRPSNELAAHHLLELVGRLGPDGASLAPQVLPFLEGENVNLRGRALSTLERIGGAPELLVPALRRVLTATSFEHHVLALRVLVKLGPAAAPALPEVTAILVAAGDGAAPATRRGGNRERENQALVVLQALGHVGAAGRRALVALIARPEVGLAPGAALTLARLSATEPEAAADLVGCLASSDEAARSAVLQALATIQPLPEGAQQALLSMLGSDDPLAANQALSVLQRVELPVAALTMALVRGLGRSAPPPGLKQAWSQLLQTAPDAAVEALPAAPSPLPRPVIDGLIEHAGRVGSAAARLKGLAHLAAWAKTLERPEAVPEGLENALTVWVGSAPQAWAVLEPLLLQGHTLAAQLAAGVTARAEVLRPQVLGLLASHDGRARRAGLSVLLRQQSPLSAEQDLALVTLLADPEPLLREQAARVILGGAGAGARDPSQRPADVQARLHGVVLAALRAQEPERRSWGVSVTHGQLPPSEEAVDALLPLLWDEGLTAAPQAVVQALRRVAGGREEATCVRLLLELERPDPLRAAGAALGLVTLACHKERVAALLPGLLSAEPSGARRRALRAVRALGTTSPEIEAGVRALVRDPERLIAIDALQLLPALAKDLPAARTALLEVAQDPTCRWSGEAVAALGQLGFLAAEDLVGLMAVPTLRSAAIHALRTMGPAAHDVLPRLEAELLRTPEDLSLKALVSSLNRGGGAAPR